MAGVLARPSIRSLAHFVKLAGGYCLRPRAARRWQTVWGYLKITAIEKLGLRCRSVTLFGCSLHYLSAESLRQLYEEIFLLELYRPREPVAPGALIVDGGANIGLTTMYFKLLAPEAEILCFEPHPRIFAVLEQNLARNQIAGVALRRVALADRTARETFFGTNLGASLGEGHGWEESQERFTVAVQRLSELVGHRTIDVLKLDVEGSEGAVLKDLGERLAAVGQIVFEYHKWPDAGTPLPAILAALEQHGHDYEVRHWGRDQAGATCMIRTVRG